MEKPIKLISIVFLLAVLFVWLRQSDYAFLRGWQANGHETEAIPVYNGEYRLIFDENFDESPLDPAIWNDQYLASWTPDMESARAVYEVADGNAESGSSMRIPSRRNPEFDGTVRDL